MKTRRQRGSMPSSSSATFCFAERLGRVLLFVGAIAWAMLLPPAYPCGRNATTGLGRVGPNEPTWVGAPGELRPTCAPRAGIGLTTWARKDNRLPLRLSVALGGATVGLGLVVLGRRQDSPLLQPN
jgi:hypothetical protein